MPVGANGNTLFTGDINNDLKFYVFEADPTGAIVWQQSLYRGRGYVAYRLDNGDTGQRTVLSARCGIQVRMTKSATAQPHRRHRQVLGRHAEHPNARLKKFSGFSVVPKNGNVIVANWLGDGNIGTGPHAVEFDANNKLVWSWEDPVAAETITNLLVGE